MTDNKNTDRKALVVDNNPVIVKLVASILEGEGYVVQTAVDGLAGVDLVDRFRPDIVFTDLVMPGIDGMKLCHIIRNTPEYQDIFIVVLSGVALEDDTGFFEIGADICIAKGIAVNMRKHILAALKAFRSENKALFSDIQGLEGLYPREVTRELLINKRHYEVVFDQMLEGSLELDDQGRVIRVNSACCRIFQIEEAGFLASNFVELLPEKNAELLRQWMANFTVSETSPPLVFDYDNPVLLDNRYVIFNFVPINDGNRFTIVGILSDITRRKEMEAKQEKLEREIGRMRTLEAMTSMAGGIAHDFNNLLTVINGNVEMAQLVTDDEKVKNLLEETGRALQLTTDLVRQLSHFSDNYCPEISMVCVDELLTDIIEWELAGTKVTLNHINDEGKYYSNLHSELIVQSFRNIIANAVEAMDGRGELTVCLSAVNGGDDADWVEQLEAGSRYVHITIEDTGQGMSLETMDKAFDPYFSTKQRGSLKGMGLGLTIAYSAIMRHGGLLCLDSPDGQGCTVSIYLPVISSAAGKI